MKKNNETGKPIQLLFHDLDPEEFRKQFPSAESEYQVFSREKKISPCMGCYSCWLKTPGVCVIRDDFQKLGALSCRAVKTVFISRCVYGGFSPFIKNTMDRNLGGILPFFKNRSDGRMHHAIRNNNRDVLSVLFYGQDITPEERQTAEQIVKANALNRNALSYSVQFYSDSGEIREDRL